MDTLDVQKRIHACAVEKGWWREKRNFGESIALCHSELSEALEAWRRELTWCYNSTDGKPEGWVPELADAIIRILDIAEANGVDMGKAVEEKVQYNWTRPYRHGGLRA